MKTGFICLITVFAASILLTTSNIRAQQCDDAYGQTWEKAHTRCCTEYCEYPWTRCQAGAHHAKSVQCAGPAKTCGESQRPAGGCGESYASNARCGESQYSECGHQHCSPRNLYNRNLQTIKGLKCGYCVSSSYVETLRCRNESAYQYCRMHQETRCFRCDPPADYGRRPTLEAVGAELESLKTKCFVHTHQ